MIRYYGDIPQRDLDLVKELKEQEIWFNINGSTIAPLLAAKAFVCLAHDYYSVYFDEEGERLLRLADKHYSGYFSDAIYTHMVKDYEFAHLIKNLQRSLGLLVMVSLGFADEQI